MIQILKYPETDRFLLDGNNTEVSVTSTNGVGYYFRAEIYIDDALFDEQSWSRADNYTATKDLIYLYNAYFETVFSETFSTGLVEQTHLVKKVNITVSEYLIADDSLVEELELPDFYMLFNTKSVDFDDTDKLTILGLDAEVMRVPTTGNIVIPFFVNADSEALSITATLNDNTVIDTQSVASFTDKRVYLYTLNLADETITYYHLYITIALIIGDTTVTKTYKLIRNPHFSVKEIVFQNNFGFYIPVYFDGELETTTGYKVETYEQYNETEVVYAVDTSLKYSLNTNGLLSNENAIVNQVAQALVCKFKNGLEYQDLITQTTRTKDTTDKEHQFNTKLLFEFKSNINKANVGFTTAPECDDIVINGDENVNETIAKSVFNDAFSPNTINYIVFTELPDAGDLYVSISSLTSFVVLNQVYDYSAISSFLFIPDENENGTPYTTFKFQVLESGAYSNVATATVNIAEGSGNFPVIEVDASARVILNESGNGHLYLPATITDPDDDLDTILWEFVGTPYPDTTLSNETTATVLIDVSGGEDGAFQIKCTATDDLGNITTKTVTIAVGTYVVVVNGAQITGSSGSDTDRIYEINLEGGVEGETVTIQFDYDVYESSRYVLVNYGEDTEFVVSLLNRRQEFTYTFDASGEIMFHVLMDDNNIGDHALMTLDVLKPTGGMLISEDNGTIEI